MTPLKRLLTFSLTHATNLSFSLTPPLSKLLVGLFPVTIFNTIIPWLQISTLEVLGRLEIHSGAMQTVVPLVLEKSEFLSFNSFQQFRQAKICYLWLMIGFQKYVLRLYITNVKPTPSTLHANKLGFLQYQLQFQTSFSNQVHQKEDSLLRIYASCAHAPEVCASLLYSIPHFY